MKHFTRQLNRLYPLYQASRGVCTGCSESREQAAMFRKSYPALLRKNADSRYSVIPFSSLHCPGSSSRPTGMTSIERTLLVSVQRRSAHHRPSRSSPDEAPTSHEFSEVWTDPRQCERAHVSLTPWRIVYGAVCSECLVFLLNQAAERQSMKQPHTRMRGTLKHW